MMPASTTTPAAMPAISPVFEDEDAAAFELPVAVVAPVDVVVRVVDEQPALPQSGFDVSDGTTVDVRALSGSITP
jgi:hypothetical protein